MHRSVPPARAARLAGVAAALAAVASGCTDGQLVDAGGERGGGGLAFVLLFVFSAAFMAVLFALDRVRRRAEDRDREQDRSG